MWNYLSTGAGGTGVLAVVVPILKAGQAQVPQGPASGSPGLAPGPRAPREARHRGSSELGMTACSSSVLVNSHFLRSCSSN